METATGAAPLSQYLSFFAAEEEYGLGILEVTELVEYKPVTKVPSVPPYVKGVINVRGRVVPVLDLASRFGMGDTAISRWTCIVLVDAAASASGVVGLLADRVSEVVELAQADIQPPPSFGTRARTEFLKGVGRAGERFVLLLDVDALLTEEAAHAVAQAEGDAVTSEAPEATAAPAAAAPASASADDGEKKKAKKGKPDA